MRKETNAGANAAVGEEQQRLGGGLKCEQHTRQVSKGDGASTPTATVRAAKERARPRVELSLNLLETVCAGPAHTVLRANNWETAIS